MAVTDGTILTGAEVKRYIPIEHDGDDDLLSDLIAEAEAEFQSYLERPITTDTFTEVHDGGTSVLFLRRWPVVADSVVVTDTQGTPGDATDDETVDSALYRVDARTGEVMRTTRTGMRSRWPTGRQRFSVQYDGGLDQMEGWDEYEKDRIRRSLRDLVTEWYENRQPGASRTEEGGRIGRSTGDADRALPRRVTSVWDNLVEP